MRIGVVALARAVVATGEQPDDGEMLLVPGEPSPAACVQRVSDDVGLEPLDGLLPDRGLRPALVEGREERAMLALRGGRLGGDGTRAPGGDRQSSPWLFTAAWARRCEAPDAMAASAATSPLTIARCACAKDSARTLRWVVRYSSRAE